ncbi:SMI1/KNR4 family protein [Streptomyces sp. 35G-GA-8]|uniref:SMI1/KNR4 family protein n=1 Tax=Streptomyces sp. 35G-GA-8 TaxID=2939434 RepID=UPI00201F51D2|nr:SMI1/KNR4 family protein [Streptomyces sp. 35G-GA-8]MCL7382488.1 SMI1/KNR4 family protein [Streptomyces sp. 35G-GA-8]
MLIRSPEDEALAEVWGALTRWLAEHAPTSYASLLPPVPEEDIAAADGQLRQRLGYGLPAELTALWRLCGGVEHQEIEGDEQEEVASGAFLPGGVVLTPEQAMSAVLLGGERGWGAPVVFWLTRDEAGPESGHYAGPGGVGSWELPEGIGAPRYPSIAAYLRAVHRTLTAGPADLMGSSEVPGLVYGCLIWDDPESSWLTRAAGDWVPLH